MKINQILNNSRIVLSSFLICSTISLMSCVKKDADVSISSPSELNILKLQLIKGKIFYSIFHNNNVIISNSQLGLKFKGGQTLITDFKIKKIETQHVDEIWEQPWGEEDTTVNKFNEHKISLVSVESDDNWLDIIIRAYDDGFAFRYQVIKLGDNKDVIISDEITEFNIANDAQSWWIKAYNPNRYEQLYSSSLLSDIDTVHTPLTMRFKSGTHISIHEASLTNYSSMQIVGGQSSRLHCDLAPWSNGDKVRTSIPFQTPWRTIKIANSASDLLSSRLNLNCNPPNKLGDVSWVKPSKYVGIWWGMIIGKWTWGEGFRHGATTERSKKYIDFASRNGFDEVLIEGISAGFTGLFVSDTVMTNYIKTTPDFNLIEVQNYAKSKGVSLQAYHETSASTLNYMAQIDDAFSLMNELGMKKAKIGHVGDMLDKSEYHYGQHGVNYYRKVLEKAAEYKIAVNFHEPIKDTGERRTYPNMLTREGARGMEYNAWGNGGNPVEHTTILPFTRMLESPMDFTPGIFDLLYQKLDNKNVKQLPVKITFVDKGNGYSNVRFKSGESFWQTKPMDYDIKINGKDTIFLWSIDEMMKPGEWEWGVSAHDVATDNNNLWLPNILKIKNNKIIISESGKITGDLKITIPNQGIDPSDRYFASKTDVETLGSNVLGKTQRVNTTLAKQLAYYIVLYSPVQMASDFIENYKDQPAFQFIKDVPVDWQTTKIINGEIGEFVTIARKDKNSGDWYLGTITNGNARNLEVSMDFLDSEKEYVATIYRDRKDSDWKKNPNDIIIERKKLTKKENLVLELSSGGGAALRIAPYNK
jgi:alpha-glucosidase